MTHVLLVPLNAIARTASQHPPLSVLLCSLSYSWLVHQILILATWVRIPVRPFFLATGERLAAVWWGGRAASEQGQRRGRRRGAHTCATAHLSHSSVLFGELSCDVVIIMRVQESGERERESGRRGKRPRGGHQGSSNRRLSLSAAALAQQRRHRHCRLNQGTVEIQETQVETVT